MTNSFADFYRQRLKRKGGFEWNVAWKALDTREHLCDEYVSRTVLGDREIPTASSSDRREHQHVGYL